jgi:hypothetical protein
MLGERRSTTMTGDVFVGSVFVAKYPSGGGNYLVPLQYVLGFRELGINAFWLEIMESTGRSEVDDHFIERFLFNATSFGISEYVILVFFPSGIGHADHRIVYGMRSNEFDARTGWRAVQHGGEFTASTAGWLRAHRPI